MAHAITAEMTKSIEDTLDVVAKSLHDASDRTVDLSEEASEVLVGAAEEVVRVAEQLRKHAIDATKDAARRGAEEVQQHPIASLAAALAAVATLVGVIAATRHRNHERPAG
jgi:ElaB/YqjD/DUF883 family membrane-anchored ribosome-binding protein